MAEVAQNANLHKRTLSCRYFPPPLMYFHKIITFRKKNNAKLLKI